MYRWVTGLLIIFVFTSTIGCKDKVECFVKTDNGSFTINGKPYYFIGTNYWYGSIIASKGSYGDRPRLLRELDQLKEMGINNLRIYVGSEGPDRVPFRVTPTLQVAPGVYNEELLDGLDFLLSEMGKRGQYAILFLNNSWDWSGGYSQYLNWNGYGPVPYPSIKPNTWPQFINYAAQFIQCDKCKEQFANHVKFILGRTNRYTGKKYTEDPAIMTWEIGNEPRAFSTQNIPAFEEWIKEISGLIKSLDENHLVTTGTEGQHGCEESMDVFEQIHSFSTIDYLTMHIWPKNWGWLDVKDINSTLDASIINTNIYINDHIAVAKRLNKPIVLEEFGLPRDFHGYSPEESTLCRDKYYQNAFQQVIDNAKQKGVLCGCNFWTYSGEGRPVTGRIYWKEGDDYLGDPPVEEQGLNSVFDTDKTVSLVTEYNSTLKMFLK
jgi:mannan endo-1,4-beta-mannosidase